MASLNKAFLIGNLTRDPELRYIPSGSAVCSFTIASNRVYKTQTGEKKEEVSFVRVVVWGRMGEICSEYLKKGRSVFVEGRLQSRSWDAPDGQKRSTLEVIALNVQFLGSGPGAGGAGTGARGASVDAGAQAGGREELPEIQLDEPADMGAPKSEEDVPF
jgi:single-strand DNA-binding protein